MAKSSIKKNFAYQLSYELLVLLLPLITSPYISRVIGASGTGIYSFTHSVAQYFVLFAMLGVLNYGNRAVAQSRDDQEKLNTVFSEILVVHLAVSVLVILAYILYVVLIAKEKLYAMIEGLFVISAFFDISWFYFGIEKFKLTVTRSIFIKIIFVVLLFTLVNCKEDLWKYCVLMESCVLANQLFLWFPLKKYVSFVRPNITELRKHIKPLFVLFIPAIAVSLYKYMDKIMIGTLSDETQLGYYENAEKLISIPLGVIVSFGTVMLPKMSNLAISKDSNQAEKYISMSVKYIMCIAFALTFGLAGIARVFAPVFWGDEFATSGTIIMGLSLTIPFISFANIVRTQYLLPNHCDKEYMVSVFSGAGANLLINWALISSFGAVGAMIGTIFAEGIVCLIQTLYVKNELSILAYIKTIIPSCVFGCIMFVCVFGWGETHSISTQTLLIQIAMGGIVYLACVFLWLYLTKDVVFQGLLNHVFGKLKKKSAK